MTYSDMRDKLADDLYLSGEQISETYAKDWSEAVPHLPEVVLRPRTIEELSEIVTLANQHQQRLVTQGGRTGLAGGATPQQSEWALTTERLNRIIDIDPIGKTITVEAGVTLQQIQEAAAEYDLLFPLDLGARGTATAGGVTSTNAGGNQVIHYGVTRHLILGLTAVLPDGQIMAQNNTLLKNNAGFDLKQLMIGTEGVLGVVAQVTFRLFPRRDVVKTAFCAAPDFESVTALLSYAGQKFQGLSSFEVLWQDYMEELLHVTKRKPLFPNNHAFYVLLEVEQSEDTGFFEDTLMKAVEDGIISDALIAHNEAQRQSFWAIRDSIAEIISDIQPCVNFDIGLSLKEMKQFTETVSQKLQLAFPGMRLVTFGHLGDGNIHICCTSGSLSDHEAIEDLVFKEATSVGGTITAEHGIGILKKQWLSDCRSNVEIDMMRRLKQMLDPNQILNKGRVI